MQQSVSTLAAKQPRRATMVTEPPSGFIALTSTAIPILGKKSTSLRSTTTASLDPFTHCCNARLKSSTASSSTDPLTASVRPSGPTTVEKGRSSVRWSCARHGHQSIVSTRGT